MCTTTVVTAKNSQSHNWPTQMIEDRVDTWLSETQHRPTKGQLMPRLETDAMVLGRKWPSLQENGKMHGSVKEQMPGLLAGMAKAQVPRV